MLNLSWFDAYIIVVVYFWYISAPLTLQLGYVAVFAKSTKIGWRSVSGIGALILLLPFVWWGANTIQEKQRRQQNGQEREAHSWLIQKPTTVAGIHLAADSKIYFDTWYDMSKKEEAKIKDINDFELSEPTKTFGAIVNGEFHKSDYYWLGTLDGDQVLNGWPCTGKVEITNEGKLGTCTLFRNHKVFGRRIPKGSKIELRDRDWTFNGDEIGIVSFDPKTGKLAFDSDSTDAFNINH